MPLGKSDLVINLVVFFSLVSCAKPTQSPQTAASQKISSRLQASIIDKEKVEPQKVWVYLTDKGPSNGMSYKEVLNQPVNKAYRTALEEVGARVRTESRWLNAISLEVDNVDDLDRISEMPFVLRMDSVQQSVRPKDPPQIPKGTSFQVENSTEPEMSGSYSLNYGPSLKQVEVLGIPQLREEGLTAKGVTIAIFDTGFAEHEALQRLNVLSKKDYVKDAGVQDFSHGVSALSAIGGYAPGKLIGPAFDAKFRVYRTEIVQCDLDEDMKKLPKCQDLLTEEDHWTYAVEDLESSMERDSRVIVSSSLGYISFQDRAGDGGSLNYDYSELNGKTTAAAITANRAAEEFGILIINAVGNDGEKGPGSLSTPADALGVLAVGAINPFGEVADFSSQGPTADGRIKPDVVAPGVGIYVATHQSRSSYGRVSGTSFSGPLVAGLAALLWTQRPTLTVKEITALLKETASKAHTPDNQFGYGLVNGVAASRAILRPKPVPIS